MSVAALTETEFVRFVGKDERSSEVSDFVKSIGAPPEVDSFEDGARKYFTFPEHGLDIVFDDGVATSCHLFGVPGEDAVRPYGGPLPHGLRFTDSRAEVLAKLGEPAKSHPGRHDSRPNVRISPWAKFSFPTHAVHVQFTQDCSGIERVTLQAVT